MIPLRLSEIASHLDGQLIGDDIIIERLVIDSRVLEKGEAFLALKGGNFDGHRFIEQVVEKGCVALIVDHQQDTNTPQIIVKDTHQALGQVGAYVKQQVAPKTVAITGSSGKTTVKEMLAAILSQRGNVLATNGNFNNDIGVPLTLLRLNFSYDYAVVELGANHLGEIAYTSELVKPDVAMINNIAAAHLEGFGDLAGVARAKGEIFQGLKAGGTAIYNQDSVHSEKWQWRLTDKKVKIFSCTKKAECFSSNVTLDDNGCAYFYLNTPIGRCFIELAIPGNHNVCNAIAAATSALECGASLEDIRLGLSQMKVADGRMNLHQLGDNFKLVDDTYNANVESVKAAVDVLASYSGRKIMILGDMGELGSEARSYHQEIGEYCNEKPIDDLLSLGVLSQSASDVFIGNSLHLSERGKLVSEIKDMLKNEQKNIAVVVKGSRSAHMELVVADIIQWRKEINDEEKH